MKEILTKDEKKEKQNDKIMLCDEKEKSKKNENIQTWNKKNRMPNGW